MEVPCLQSGHCMQCDPLMTGQLGKYEVLHDFINNCQCFSSDFEAKNVSIYSSFS